MIQKTGALVYKYFFVRVLFFPENESHPWDYYAHFILSFLLVGVLFGIFWAILAFFSPKLPGDISNGKAALIAASVTTLALGAIKEMDDWRAGYRDIPGDLLGDVLGVGLFILATFATLVIVNIIMSFMKTTP